MARGVLVFDESVAPTQVGGESGQAFMVLDDSSDVLVFDAKSSYDLLEGSDPETDFIVFDSRVTVTEAVQAPADFLLVDPPKDPARVTLSDDTMADVMVITSGGPPGAPGEPGEQGPQGEPGLPGPGAYYQEFSFAIASTIWTVIHNQGSLGLNVETVDTNGDPLEGHVVFVDPNVIEIQWYFPMAGTARVFR